MVRVIFTLSFYCLFLFDSQTALAAQEQVNKEPSARESVRLKALQQKEASAYQDQQYDSEKSFLTKDFFSQQQSRSNLLPPNNYPSHSFFGLLNPWLGKQTFVTKNTSSFSKQNRDFQRKTFSTRVLRTTSCSLASQSDDIMSKKFPMPPVQLDPKAQGSLDRDEHLQQALKKKMTLDQVRALLDQGI